MLNHKKVKNIPQVHTSEKKLSTQMAAAQSWHHWCGISQCGEKGHVDFAVSLLNFTDTSPGNAVTEIFVPFSKDTECNALKNWALHMAASVLHRKTTVCLSLSNNQTSQTSTQVLKAWNACRCKTPKALDLCRVIA